MLDEARTFIYALSCPDTGEVRYVGKTIWNPERRLSQHLVDARNGKTYRANWLRQVMATGKRPICTVVEVCYGDDWIAAEQFWIDYYRSQGALLTNLAAGGIGNTGYTRAGAGLPPMPKHWLGRRHGPEAKRKVSEARKGKPLSTEHRAKLSAAHKGVKHSTEQIEARREGIRRGWAKWREKNGRPPLAR